MIIYLDMDDVVADWMAHARNVAHGNWQYGQRIPDADWQKIKQDQRFYLHLPVKEGAEDLIRYCNQLKCSGKVEDVKFLTALPHDYSVPYAAQDKVWWAHLHFPGIPVFIGPYSHDKWRHCKPGDILIDDRASNCADWRAEGGLAHEYRDWPSCRQWLEETIK